MIFSVLLRSYKVYQNITYIPISEAAMFSAFVGENGVGKSAVLESLDVYFNNSDWNFNHVARKKGFHEREPYICPIFLIDKSKISRRKRKIVQYLETLSDITWQLEDDDFNPSNKKQASVFCFQRERLKNHNIDEEGYYLFPLGIGKNSSRSDEFTLSIFSSVPDYKDRLEELGYNYEDVIKEVYEFLCNFYRYIYIPSDIDFENYTKIEGKTVQALMGKKVEEIVKGFIEEDQVKEINRRLEDFMADTSENLKDYVYKKDSKRQNRVNLTHLSSKIIDAYFDNKVLNLKSLDDRYTPVYNLSSGEKRKAIIDISRAFLLKSKAEKSSKEQQVIFAIDEPEISLHVGSCYSQFQKIREISDNNIQVLLTTHWYGFIPILSDGLAVYMSTEQRRPCMIDLRCFRDEIKKIKEATKGEMPSNIELKGINDLVQSIIASITSANCKWIVCEGVSDKIYLEKNFNSNEVFILPIGKAKYVKKIFNHLVLALEEDKDSIEGRVYLIVDTDKQLEVSDCKDSVSKIRIRRIQNDESSMKTGLKKLSDTAIHPPTEIEDTLDAEAFQKTIAKILVERDIVDDFKELESISIQYEDAPSGLAFNLSQSQIRELTRLFDLPRMKVEFALEYVSCLGNDYEPEWVNEVADFLQVRI